MKPIKYIISFFILFICMLIIGESHIFRLDNFYTEFYSTSMFLQPETTDKEMIDDIADAADRNDVEVFTFIRSPRSTFFTEYNIYGTSGVKKYINENLNIDEAEYSSLFLGKIRFNFNEIRSIHGIENFHDFYIIGDKEKANQFKMQLIDKYAGNHPQEGYVYTESRNTVLSTWLLCICIIIFLSYYDVLLQKKENLIRFSMGERITKIFWKNTLLDTLVFISFFALSTLILSKFTYVLFEFKISLFLFLGLIIINALLYLNLYFYNVKEVFSNAKGSRKILSLNYGLKLATAIITIILISSNIALIMESVNLYKQKSFFEEHADYAYTQLENRLVVKSDGSIESKLDEDAIIQEKFYKEFFDKFDATLLTNISNMIDEEGALANKNAYHYLSKKIKELNDIELNKDIYFLMPKKMSGDSEIIDKLQNVVKFYEGDNFSFDYGVIYYDGNVDIIRIDEMYIYGSEIVENPVIIYNNIAADTIKEPVEVNLPKLNYVHDIMYKISDDEFDRFVALNGLSDQNVTKTNVLEKYNYYWAIAKRVLYINSVFSILVLLLETIIISAIIKLEYETNAVELSIKKVIGYSLVEKNSKIITLTIITTAVGITSSIIVSILLNFGEVFHLFIGGIIILLLELSIIFLYAQKIENTNVQRILKGGNI